MKPDQFVFEVDRAEWLFTVALGLGLGLTAAAVVVALWRPNGWLRLAVVLGFGGILVSALTGTLAVDAAPWSRVDLPLRPYFSSVAFTVAMAGALLLGMLLTGILAMLGILAAHRRGLPPAAGPAWSFAVAVIVLMAIVPIIERAARGSRHPEGTDTSSTVPFVLVHGGLDAPTGVDVADNGHILVVELAGNRVLLLEASAGSYGVKNEIPLGLPAGQRSFHAVFHPAYPEVPYAYVVTQAMSGDLRTNQVVRVSLEGPGQVEPVIPGLPTAQGLASNHHGAGLAVCGEYLFVSTSDGDSLTGRAIPGSQRWAERARAQLPNSGFGQLMRWRFNGLDLEPAGVFGLTYPSFAMGLRNPFGIGCDPVTGNPLVSDNGERGHDQVRLAEPGSNHGWPTTYVRNDIVEPWFDGAAVRVAPTGIAARPDSPNVLVMSAFASEALYELTIDRGEGKTLSVRLLTEVDGGAFAVTTGPGGCVYFTDASAVWRLQEPGCE